MEGSTAPTARTKPQRALRVFQHKWTALRLLTVLLFDLLFSSVLYQLYTRAADTQGHQVFKWILIGSLIRFVWALSGTCVAVVLGVPSERSIARALTRQVKKNYSGNEVIDDARSRLKARHDNERNFFSLLTRRKRNVETPAVVETWSSPAESSSTITPQDDLTKPFIDEEARSKKDDDCSPQSSTYKPPSDVSTPPPTEVTQKGKMEEYFGTEELRQLDEETRYRRAVTAAEEIAHFKRNIVLVFVFLGLTTTNLISCIWFVSEAADFAHMFGPVSFLSLPIHGWLMTGIIITAAYEFFCVREVVFRSTIDKGVLLRSVHPHKIYFKANMEGHSCDVCRKRIRALNSSPEAYTCLVCDFDCCIRCFKLRSLDKGEGILRSDQGPKPIVEYSVRVYLRRALQLSFPFVHWLVFSFAFLVTTQIVGLMLPNYQGKVIDDLFKEDAQKFKHDILFYGIGSVLTAILSAMSQVCVQIVQKNLEVGVRVKLFEGVLGQDVAFFDGMMTGQICSRLQSDTQQLVSPCYTILNSGFSNVIMLLGALYMCLYTSWELTILAMCSIGPIVTITNSYAQWANPLWSKVWNALGEANSIAFQAIMNIRSVRSFATEGKELEKYQGALNIVLQRGLLNAIVSSISGLFSGMTELAIGVLILAMGGKFVMDGNNALTVGQLVAFQLYWNKMDGAYTSLNGILNQLIETSAAAERVFSLMDCAGDIETPPKGPARDSWGRLVKQPIQQEMIQLPSSGKLIPPRFTPMDINAEGLRFTYQMRPESQVLKGIDLRIPHGTVCALVGRSGGGKSTLIHMLQRFYDPQDGRILYGGVDLRQIDLSWYRGQIGVVAQDTQLFNLSLKENISYGCPHPVTLAAVVDAAKKACLHDFIVSLDEGYDTPAGERGTRLSGGQKQRVAIARALLRRPRLLLLDEATSSLDAESEAQVQKALDNLMVDMAGECTIVLVAHRLSTVINSDRIFVVDKGIIAESGTHQELLDCDGIYANLIRQQLSKKNNKISEAKEETEI